jgi:hypothetical protein
MAAMRFVDGGGVPLVLAGPGKLWGCQGVGVAVDELEMVRYTYLAYTPLQISQLHPSVIQGHNQSLGTIVSPLTMGS